MLIQSQNKKEIQQFMGVRILETDEGFKILNGKFPVGTFKTEEVALEIIDKMKIHMNNLHFQKLSNSRYQYQLIFEIPEA